MKIFSLFIMLFFASLNAYPQEVKFGHMNSSELLTSLPEFDAARQNLEKFRDELEKYINEMVSELSRKYDEFVKTGNVLSEIVRQVKEQEINDQNRRIQEFQESAQVQLQAKESELFQPVYEKVNRAITEVGKEGGFYYIFDTSNDALFYVNESTSINVMQQVRNKLTTK